MGTFGILVKSYRERASLSQSELARQVEIALDQVTDWSLVPAAFRALS